MKDLQAKSLILSVSEIRKIANSVQQGCLDDKSDDEVEQHITELDFLAELFLKGVVARKETAYKKED